jgi:DNA-binding MarR family transcriptional regulator
MKEQKSFCCNARLVDGVRCENCGADGRKPPLTERQRDVYVAIAGYIQDQKYSPTYQEVAERTGMSSQMVEAHVKNLVAKGWIKFRQNQKHRKLELIPKEDK